ncbi:alpha/beta fold hydrolase [Nocardia alni]|uniref:alpha/beta fold hydrolase n=1 Tax=Nocardia alni TaxID=2815723 RepID=UPI001C21BCFE|nr:alpha/beta hydrolase [Nocardia alni]
MTHTAPPETVGAGFTEHTVEIDGFTVRYQQSGTGDPVVVLHGAGGLQHTPAMDLLATRYRIVLLEIPGFGPQANDIHQTMPELAEAIAQAIANIGLERYHLIGISFGGVAATHLALAHSETLISLVLEAPAAFREGGASPSNPPSEILPLFRAHPERTPPFQMPDPDFTRHTGPMIHRLLASRPEYDQELADRLPELSTRTLVIFGDRDGVIPPHNGRTWRQLLPNCSYILVHDAAHDIQCDRPESYAEVVGDWLARGWQFLVPEQDTVINP